jgi:hypothetical protein
MKTFEIDCFEVRESDGDGRGDHHVCYCANNTVAQTVSGRNQGWRTVRKYSKFFNIIETEDEYLANTKAAIRKIALAKLSNAEREALGV